MKPIKPQQSVSSANKENALREYKQQVIVSEGMDKGLEFRHSRLMYLDRITRIIIA